MSLWPPSVHTPLEDWHAQQESFGAAWVIWGYAALLVAIPTLVFLVNETVAWYQARRPRRSHPPDTWD